MLGWTLDTWEKLRGAERSCTWGSRLTCAASLQACSVGRHHPRVSSLARFSNPDLEGTSGDVTTVELHINQVEAILSGDEADRVLI